jgi:hypothetical protein
MVEARESGKLCKPLIGRPLQRVIFKMGFKQPKNPIRLIGLVLPRLEEHLKCYVRYSFRSHYK